MINVKYVRICSINKEVKWIFNLKKQGFRYAD